MATATSWNEVLTLIAEMDARAADALVIDQLRWHVLDASAQQANTDLITGSSIPTGSPSGEPDAPVVPPDDPSAPDVDREPSIDPPPTAPPTKAPSEDPREPPPRPQTTSALVRRR